MRCYSPFRWHLWLALSVLLILAGCEASSQPYNQVDDEETHLLVGDPDAGQVALQAYGCDACHTIPGVPGANSLVGPPLTAWAERRYIAGKLINEPINLVEWIRFPQAIEPGTAMPNMDVTEEDAVHMAAYLYTLRDEQRWYRGLSRFLSFGDE